jgi:hypothetical protein
MRRLSLATLLALAVCLASSANAVTLNVSGGQLLGASDVLVNGNPYDVEFVDGTCIDLFNGCDSAADFTFATVAAATSAAQALLDQVFVNGAAGLFDDNPFSTAGCADASVCSVETVYAGDGFQNNNVVALNWSALSGIPDAVGTFTGLSDRDYAQTPTDVFARWTLVPEPGTGTLMTLGLIGFAAKRRRSN